MKRTCVLAGVLVVVLWFAAGCGTTPLPPRAASDWRPASGEKAEWALKCDCCGKIYAHNVYRTRVSLDRHRKWAADQGNVSVVHDGKTFDVCTAECEQKLMAAKGIKSTEETPVTEKK